MVVDCLLGKYLPSREEEELQVSSSTSSSDLISLPDQTRPEVWT